MTFKTKCYILHSDPALGSNVSLSLVLSEFRVQLEVGLGSLSIDDFYCTRFKTRMNLEEFYNLGSIPLDKVISILNRNSLSYQSDPSDSTIVVKSLCGFIYFETGDGKLCFSINTNPEGDIISTYLRLVNDVVPKSDSERIKEYLEKNIDNYNLDGIANCRTLFLLLKDYEKVTGISLDSAKDDLHLDTNFDFRKLWKNDPHSQRD